MNKEKLVLLISLPVIFIIALIVNSNYMIVQNFKKSKNKIKEGALIEIDIEAQSLKGNKLNEPDTQPIVIYLPPSYNKNDDKRYPVIYFLPGFYNTIQMFVNDGSYNGFRLKESMDKNINEGKIKELIVVIVNGYNKLKGSFYVNSIVTGNWEDFVVKDCVNYVDNNYKTINSKDSRGISGHSMGGFGALNIAMHHSDIFCAVYSLSPGIIDDKGLKEIIDQWNSVSWGQSVINAYGAAFAPDLKEEYPYAGIPKKVSDLNWIKWEDGYGNLRGKIITYKKNLLSLKGIVMDVGINEDFPWLLKGCRYFSKELNSQNIQNQLIEFDGTHQNKLGERIENYLIPYFSKILIFE